MSQALARVGMTHARLRPFEPLSGGEKQCVLVALSFVLLLRRRA